MITQAPSSWGSYQLTLQEEFQLPHLEDSYVTSACLINVIFKMLKIGNFSNNVSLGALHFHSDVV